MDMAAELADEVAEGPATAENVSAAREALALAGDGRSARRGAAVAAAGIGRGRRRGRRLWALSGPKLT